MSQWILFWSVIVMSVYWVLATCRIGIGGVPCNLLDLCLVHCSSFWIDVVITSDGWTYFEDMVHCPLDSLGWATEEKKFKLKLRALIKWLAKWRCLFYWAVTFAGVICITELYFIVLKRSWSVLFTPSLMCMRMYSCSRFHSALPRSVSRLEVFVAHRIHPTHEAVKADQ
jgi:hypothetical protein